MGLNCCHGNRYEAGTNLKVLPNSTVNKMFIVYPYDPIQYFV